MGNLVIFDLTFLPGGSEFDSNLLENVKNPPYALPPPPPPSPPAGLTLIGALWREKREVQYVTFWKLSEAG